MFFVSFLMKFVTPSSFFQILFKMKTISDSYEVFGPVCPLDGIERISIQLINFD